MQQLAPLSPATPQTIAAVDAVDRINRSELEYDIELLDNLGKAVSARQAVAFTHNAMLVFHALNSVPAGLSEVLLADDRQLTAAAKHPAHHGDGHPVKFSSFERSAVQSGVDLLVLVDFADAHRFPAAWEVFCSGGRGSRLVMYSSLRCSPRIFLDHCVASGEFKVDHLPATRGLTILSRSSSARTNTKSPDLDEAWALLCAESQWLDAFAGRNVLPDTLGGLLSRMQPRRMLAAAKAVMGLGSATAEADAPAPNRSLTTEQTVQMLAQRASAMCLEAQAFLNASLPSYPPPPPPEGARAHSGGAIVERKPSASFQQELETIRKFVHADGVRGRLHATIFGGLLGQAADALDRAAEASASRTAGLGTEPAMTRLAQTIDHLREAAYWTRNWKAATNRTWKLILEQNPPAPGLLPKPVKPEAEYFQFYEYRSLVGAAKQRNLSRPMRNTAPEELPEHRPIIVQGAADHAVRKQVVVSIIHTLLATLGRRHQDQVIRWLDVGCGAGGIANGVPVPKELLNRVEIVGFDFKDSVIEQANRSAARFRRFVAADGLKPPASLLQTPFHLVSAFEFLEHVLDPVSFLEQYKPMCTDFMIAGSPLNEHRSWHPEPQHVWTFGREGYEAVFREAGLEVTLSSEVRIGSYVGGLDWLTVVGAKRGKIPIKI